jgi:hypothetical protein
MQCALAYRWSARDTPRLKICMQNAHRPTTCWRSGESLRRRKSSLFVNHFWLETDFVAQHPLSRSCPLEALLQIIRCTMHCRDPAHAHNSNVVFLHVFCQGMRSVRHSHCACDRHLCSMKLIDCAGPSLSSVICRARATQARVFEVQLNAPHLHKNQCDRAPRCT